VCAEGNWSNALNTLNSFQPQYHKSFCHPLSRFTGPMTAKMHQIQFKLGLHLRHHSGSWQCYQEPKLGFCDRKGKGGGRESAIWL